MNRKIYFILLICLGVVNGLSAQEEDTRVRVKGTVVDAQTGEPIPFANIGLVGTVAGVASDLSGYFELAIPPQYSTHLLRFSAIGYSPFEAKFYEMQETQPLKIELKPVSYALKNVEVAGEWMVIKGLLDKVVNNMGRNYIPRSYNYEGYFEYGISVNDEEPRTKEAIVTIYDSQGYKRSGVKDAFDALHYKFNHIRRNHAPASAREGLIYFDDILTADVVRHTRNVLDTENYRDYKFWDKGTFQYEGEEVQIIAYETQKPTLTLTGDAAATHVKGEIYIQLKDAIVIKNIMEITGSNFNIMGRSLIPIDEPAKSDVHITLTTNYKKVTSYYFLSGVSMEYTYRQGDDRIRGEVQYQTTQVRVNNVEPIEGRVYLERLEPDYNFWDRYVITLEAEE